MHGSMRAGLLAAPGGPEQLVIEQVATPAAASGWPPPSHRLRVRPEDAASAFERTMAADNCGNVVLEVTR
jgi:hypothetical protein